MDHSRGWCWNPPLPGPMRPCERSCRWRLRHSARRWCSRVCAASRQYPMRSTARRPTSAAGIQLRDVDIEGRLAALGMLTFGRSTFGMLTPLIPNSEPNPAGNALASAVRSRASQAPIPDASNPSSRARCPSHASTTGTLIETRLFADSGRRPDAREMAVASAVVAPPPRTGESTPVPARFALSAPACAFPSAAETAAVGSDATRFASSSTARMKFPSSALLANAAIMAGMLSCKPFCTFASGSRSPPGNLRH